MSNLKTGVIVLTVITALIHLVLGVGQLPNPFGIVFVLNGLGYLALMAGLYFVPQVANMRSQIRWALLGFTAVTFLGYFILNQDAFSSPLGLFDKVVELALMVLLWMERPKTA
ncbi:MAG: hypothetical protein KDE51_08975 [Anaerolineales bacterium]|nr:hypothetical protein [Anaerolineales bacterium]